MFDNPHGELFPNQFVNIKLLVNTLHDQTVVPAAAIQRGASGAFVFVVNADHTVSMRTVTLGQTQDDRVAIASGVKPGDTVVVDGADRLRDGARVVLPGERPPAAEQGAPRGPGNGRRGQGRRGAAQGQGQGQGQRQGGGAPGGAGAARGGPGGGG
jgi:multidrug efflux system membrane fusion protein